MTDFYEDAHRVERDGVGLVVTDHGEADDPAVLMLHGWPDTAYLWRRQIPALTAAGYRVIAPDLRGTGGSDMPETVDAYRIDEHVKDAVTILDQAGAGQAHVVAHDWGSATGWALSLRHPGRVRSLTALSVGHPNSFNSAGLRQLQMSWYMLLFQFEGEAEDLLSADDWRLFRRFVGGHPETERWIETLSPPGALTASLNWYRANAHPRRLLGPQRELPNCRVPTLGMWSTGDFALTERQMTGSEEHMEAEWEYRRVEDASHWIPLDAPGQLNSSVVDWLARH